MIRFFQITLFYIAALFTTSVNASELIYPGIESNSYVVQLLKHALSYSKEKDYKLKAFGEKIPKPRVFVMLGQNENIDIAFGGSTMERESKYLPIKVPLLKGLHGWRVPLVTQRNSDLLLNRYLKGSIKSLAVGQLHSWSDSKILLNNGFNVYMSSSYKGMFQMLSKGHIDYFLRSIIEVEREAIANESMGLVIEQHTLFYYPTSYYYYVNKHNKELASDIQFGLEKSIKDGSFDKIFNKHYKKFVDKFVKSQRKVIILRNERLHESIIAEKKAFRITPTPIN